MYFDDHQPPHLHAEYQGQHALFRISDGVMFEGRLPPNAIKIVSEWATIHGEDLMRDCGLAQNHLPLQRIRGADDD